MNYSFDKDFGAVVCRPSCAAEALKDIIMIGMDYDGFNTVSGLKSLIDELVQYAEDAYRMIEDGKVTEDDVREETERTYAAAFKEQEKYLSEN